MLDLSYLPNGLAAIYVKKKIKGSQKQRKWCMKATYPTIEATDSRTQLKKHDR